MSEDSGDGVENGAKKVGGSVGLAPPLDLDESASLAEIRDFINKHGLGQHVKTGGSGRTKSAILLDLYNVWVDHKKVQSKPS